MSRKAFVVSVLLGLALGGNVFPQEPQRKNVKIIRAPVERVFNPAFKGKMEAEIELFEHQLSDAIRTKNEAALSQLLSDTVLIAGLIGTKTQYIALLKTLDTKYHSFEKSEMRIQIYGDTAVATGTQKSDIDIENGSRMSQGIFFDTWKRIDGRWQCIALAN